MNSNFRKYTDKDHLHIRGEHEDEVKTLLDGQGSPPHTWRTPKGIHST